MSQLPGQDHLVPFERVKVKHHVVHHLAHKEKSPAPRASLGQGKGRVGLGNGVGIEGRTPVAQTHDDALVVPRHFHVHLPRAAAVGVLEDVGGGFVDGQPEGRNGFVVSTQGAGGLGNKLPQSLQLFHLAGKKAPEDRTSFPTVFFPCPTFQKDGLLLE